MNKNIFFLAILTRTLKFQITTTTINFPKKHWCKLLGKQGVNLKSIEQRTGARVQVPCMQNTSDIMTEGIQRDG
jgi:hypothetical protein